MKRMTKRSRHQLALSLEREAQLQITADQKAALLIALADLLLEALGVAPAESSSEEKMMSNKITADHLSRGAVVYVRHNSV
jgi:hypothetical protein